MECRIVRDILSAYIDDELSHEKKINANLHLRKCAACREAFDELLAVHKLFAEVKRFPAPLGFSTRVMGNLEEREGSMWTAFFKRNAFLETIEVVSALILVIVGLITGNILGGRQPFPAPSEEARLSFALDAFEAAPSGSIGGIYVAMTGLGK